MPLNSNALINYCPYCDKLISAIASENYCSHKEQKLEMVESNAFFFSEKTLSSNEHVSRFSIRTITNGYQLYHFDGRDHVLNDQNFLVINQGQKFSNFLNQECEAEGLIVAYNPVFINNFLFEQNHPTQYLLDNPFQKTEASLYFYNNSFTKTNAIDTIFKTLIDSIKEGIVDTLFYHQVLLDILNELSTIESKMKSKIATLNALKQSTKEELYRRLSNSKEFIDAHLGEKLSLERLSQIACLSPFHFLRSFATLYSVTPYQYILTERLKRAHFLIQNEDQSIQCIMNATGFENYRTFQRAFKKCYGENPLFYSKYDRA
jgi:AraC family transcriptional regulator